MRTIIELPEQQVEALKTISEREGLSRAELVRRAVSRYLDLHNNTTDDAAFGLWQGRTIEGLDYQQQRRAEWDQ